MNIRSKLFCIRFYRRHARLNKGDPAVLQVVKRAGKFFRGMNPKAQASLGGLASILGKSHGKFWRDTPPEPSGVKAAGAPQTKKAVI
ncbi:hypothetical protein [uncultured Allofournierella sp.]|uniref:hypothetical protein n=1 Tax=uncultured Allofournierella sp. TaxID=1940258 RepID=UPI0025F5961C|nr:hypothetical protein [uncultured Fournierella sp.]